MQGSGVQVVHVEDHSYRLDEAELRKILLRDDVKDLPVVVVSVAGAFRGGKSFVLNFFLRYLVASQSSRDDGSWIGGDNTPLEGFSWRGGSKRNTTGIVIWSEPIITTLGVAGEKVAVILMDTQGTFDSSSTVRDCSTIFALSTLLSSIQIYNVSKNIGEDHLQHLQLFTEYGKLTKDQSSKAFQVLEFLVRDWQNSSDFPYGSSGGNLYLDEQLKTDPKQAKELRDLREHIRDSFTSVSCFLLPHPGLEVFEADFNGRNNEISIKFKTYIKELTAYLFGPGRLRPKEINGQVVRASELFTYFKTYMTIFNSDEMPTPKNILQATAEGALLSAFDEARRVYEKNMEADCGTGKPSVPAHDLKELHERHVANAVKAFSNKKIMGDKNDVNKCRQKLNKDLENRLPQFVDMNIGKAQRVMNEAKEAYEAKIGQIRAEQLLCVHPSDLEQVHREALQAAMKLFDNNRKSFSKKEDKERSAFKKSFEKQYELLFRINEQNNKMAVTELRLEYWQTMEKKCSGESTLSDNEFIEEHKRARQQALDSFAIKRNHPDSYDEDSYKTNLIENITQIFRELRTMLTEKRRQRYDESSSSSSTSESNSSSQSDDNSDTSSFESSVIITRQILNNIRKPFDINSNDNDCALM